MTEQALSDGQRTALADLAGIGRLSVYVPPPPRRPDFHALIALGLARSCGPGLGGEGFAPTPAGRKRAKDEAALCAPKAARGFALMSPERRREVARLGGKSAPPHTRSFSKDRTLAAQAGRLGGEASPKLKVPTGQD